MAHAVLINGGLFGKPRFGHAAALDAKLHCHLRVGAVFNLENVCAQEQFGFADRGYGTLDLDEPAKRKLIDNDLDTAKFPRPPTLLVDDKRPKTAFAQDGIGGNRIRDPGFVLDLLFDIQGAFDPAFEC
jgi:hypothetical protein